MGCPAPPPAAVIQDREEPVEYRFGSLGLSAQEFTVKCTGFMV